MSDGDDSPPSEDDAADDAASAATDVPAPEAEAVGAVDGPPTTDAVREVAPTGGGPPAEPGPTGPPDDSDDRGHAGDDDELLATPPAEDADVATRIEAGVDEVRGAVADARVDIATVKTGLDALAPDLAAGAREETVTVGFAGLQKGLDELARLTRRADEHVAELHSENQRLRAGELAGATAPMLRDLIRLHDEVAQLASAGHPEAQPDLDLVRSRLLDTLSRWGLSSFTPAVGDPLDATRHQGVGRVPSADGAPGTIASVRKPGFVHDDGRTVRAAEVEVFVAPPAAVAPSGAAPSAAAGPPAQPAAVVTDAAAEPDADATVVVDAPVPPPVADPADPTDPPAAPQPEE